MTRASGIEARGEAIWLVDSGNEGPSVCLAFGVHGDERAPIDAGLRLVEAFRSDELEVSAGRLLLIHGNPRGTADGGRASNGGVDLNRCFHADVLAREPELYEEHRAREIIRWLEETGTEVLVDFHCTVEPGRRFLMQHPPVDDGPHRRVYELLRADTLLSDPDLNFGGVSLDEWMSTRGRVGICYETGWIHDPDNTPESVEAEMRNLLAGLDLLDGAEGRAYPEKNLLELEGTALCEEGGFGWEPGVGENLQELPAGALLGTYASGRELRLEVDSVLIFPKKRPELVQIGKPLVYLATKRG